MTFGEILDLLAAENEDEVHEEIHRYAELFVTHREASINIARHGAVVAHPKTGAPIENPYLKVRQSTIAAFKSFRLEADPLWEKLSGELEEIDGPIEGETSESEDGK